MPKSDEKQVSEKRKASRAIAKLPVTALGKHGSKRAITINVSKGDESFGEFSISHSGIQHKGKRRSWRSLVKFIDKGKRVG